MATTPGILAFAIERCRPCQLPPPWSDFPPPESFFHPPLDSAALLDGLQNRFSLDDLSAAGLVTENPAGQASLKPPWGDPAAVLFAAHDAPEAAPVAIVSDQLVEGRLPLADVLLDNRVRELANEQFPGWLFVVPSLVDAAVLRAWGFPAAPAHGLGDLQRPRLAQFRNAVGLDLEATLSPTRYALVLVPWSASRLDDSDAAQIEALGRQVDDLCQRLQRPIDLYAWRPTQLRLDRLRHCAMNFEIGDVCREAVDSFEKETYELFDPQPPRPPAIPYDQAQREFLESMRQLPADLQCREEAWRQLEESQERDFIEPILQLASESGDPLRRAMFMQFASLSRICNLELVAAAAQLNPVTAERRDRPGAPALRDTARALAMLDRMNALYQELKLAAAGDDAAAAPLVRKTVG